MTNETDSFVQEVDEGLRQDRVLAFFKQYGIWIGVAVGVLLLGLGAWQGWQAYRTNTARAHAEEYAQAQELAQEGNLDEAMTAFERLEGEGPGVYRAMATMERAAVLQQQGDLEGALAAFDEAAERADDPILRDTARLRAAYIAAETQDFPALRTRLEPLTESDSRLSYLARELLAVEAWEAGEMDLARSTFENLQLAFDAPQAVQQRAARALAVIGPAPESDAEGAASAPAPSEGETP
ncbi:MAG: tetratricopeptide repeat protein [Hyphomonadaceae bacterium]